MAKATDLEAAQQQKARREGNIPRDTEKRVKGQIKQFLKVGKRDKRRRMDVFVSCFDDESHHLALMAIASLTPLFS